MEISGTGFGRLGDAYQALAVGGAAAFGVGSMRTAAAAPRSKGCLLVVRDRAGVVNYTP